MEYTQAEILQTVRDDRDGASRRAHRHARPQPCATASARPSRRRPSACARRSSGWRRAWSPPWTRSARSSASASPTSASRSRPPRWSPSRARSAKELMPLARAIDEAAEARRRGFHRRLLRARPQGHDPRRGGFLDSIPEALATTERLCSSVNVATTRAGINMDAVRRTGEIIKEMAERTRERGRAGLRQVRLLRQRGRGQSVYGGRVPRRRASRRPSSTSASRAPASSTTPSGTRRRMRRSTRWPS